MISSLLVCLINCQKIESFWNLRIFTWEVAETIIGYSLGKLALIDFLTIN